MLRRLGFYLLITGYAFLLLFPLLTLLSASLRSQEDLFAPGLLPPRPTLEAYAEALAKHPLGRYLANSLLVSFTATLGVLLSSLTLGYALARVPFRGQSLLFGLVVALLLTPDEVLFLPRYLLVSDLGWVNTYWALILPFTASPLGVFLVRQFIKSLPQDYFDAARIDGAGHLRTLWHVATPLILPALGALAALTFIGTWNMYLWPLVVVNQESLMTVQVGMAKIRSVEVTAWNVMAAAAILALLPTLLAFLLAQRAFVRGLALGGLKG